MVEKLIDIIYKQDEQLCLLLDLLQNQYKMIMDKDLYGLEDIVDKINECSKEVARFEIERRKFDTQAINKDEKLENSYIKIKDTLEKVKVQKNTNELLLKQRIGFNAKMLAILNPDREKKTYNSYGNIRR